MFSGVQSYTIPLTGYSLLTLPPFEIAATDYPAAKKIEIISMDERHIQIKVHFENVSSTEDAVSIGKILAEQVADRLAFEYTIAACDPVNGEGSFVRRDASGAIHAVVSHSLGFTTAGHVTKAVAPSDVPQLKQTLEAVPSPRREPYLAQFRWILCQDDPVARFMHLYKILLSLEGGATFTQRNVDAFITSEEPSVTLIPNLTLHRDETIYSRLRNQVGHEIAGTTPESTRQDMEQHISKLTEHVKTAISKLT